MTDFLMLHISSYIVNYSLSQKLFVSWRC